MLVLAYMLVLSELIRIYKPVQKIEELDSHSTDSFSRNMVDRYIDRPNV